MSSHILGKIFCDFGRTKTPIRKMDTSASSVVDSSLDSLTKAYTEKLNALKSLLCCAAW